MTSDRRSRAVASLRGLAVGDALGSCCYIPDNLPTLHARELHGSQPDAATDPAGKRGLTPAGRRVLGRSRVLGQRRGYASSAAASLGSGRYISAPDTVPFCLWIAAKHPGDNSPTVTVAATDGTCTVSHAFAATGTYPVSIRVSTSDGSQ